MNCNIALHKTEKLLQASMHIKVKHCYIGFAKGRSHTINYSFLYKRRVNLRRFFKSLKDSRGFSYFDI
jgi:hypothetical protein